MRTAAVAAQLGISADWVKRLERAGKIPRVARDVNGHRRYSRADLERLRKVIGTARRRTDSSTLSR